MIESAASYYIFEDENLLEGVDYKKTDNNMEKDPNRRPRYYSDDNGGGEKIVTLSFKRNDDEYRVRYNGWNYSILSCDSNDLYQSEN